MFVAVVGLASYTSYHAPRVHHARPSSAQIIRLKAADALDLGPVAEHEVCH